MAELQSHEVFNILTWAKHQAEYAVGRHEHFALKSTATYREQASTNWLAHSEKLATVCEALEQLIRILCFEPVPWEERAGDPLYAGDTSIWPNCALWSIEANWPKLSAEKLLEIQDYIMACKLRHLTHLENEKALNS